MQRAGRPGLRRPGADRVLGAAGQRHPRARPRSAWPTWPGTSPSAPARAPRSTWCWPPARSPSSAAGTTSCPQDLTDLALDVLRHRLVLSYEALSDDVTADAVLTRVLAALPVPDARLHGAAEPMTDRARPAAAAPGVAGRPPPRRAAAGRLPHGVARHRHRLRRPARLHAGGRRPAHRLERHRPAGRAVRPAVHRGPRPDRLAGARPVGVDALRRRRSTARTRCSTELAVCLARLLTQGGNRVGAILYDNRAQRVIPPRTGRDQVLRLTHELIARRPPAGAGRAPPTWPRCCGWPRPPRAGAAWSSSSPTSSATPDWEPALARLAHRHEVVAIRVVDPVELDLPDLGLVLVEDAETGEQLLVDTSDPLLRQRLAGRGRRPRGRRWPTAMRRAGVTAHRITTDQDLLAALVDMVRRSETEAPMTLPVPGRARSSPCWSPRPRSPATRCCSAGAPRRWPPPGSARRPAAAAGRAAPAPAVRCCSSPRCRCCWSALARPQATIAVPRVAGTVILAFDVSNSMAADDVAPTRLAAAQAAATEFVEAQPDTVDIGVVVFGQRRADHPGAHRRPRRGDRRDQPARPSAAAPRSGRRSWPRSAAIIGKPVSLPDRGRAPRRRPTSATGARRRSCCSPTARTPAARTPMAAAELAADRRRAHRDRRGRHRRGRHHRGRRLPARPPR